MSKLVTRTFVTSKIYPATVTVENGEVKTVELEPIESSVKVTEASAITLARKTYGKSNQYVILAIEDTETLRGMSVDTFIANSKIIEK